MAASRTVILFDVDGTLIDSGESGRRALERAVAAVLGLPPARAEFSFAGMTDRAILRRMFAERGVEASEEALGEVLERYPALLRDEVERARDYDVLPGVLRCLEALDGRDGLAVGLGTGNVERGARVKLGRADLNRFFAFGGFGCDDEERAALLRVGAARGASRLACALEACRVVVVGDTPRDVEAAHAIGAACLAVATGSASTRELARAGAVHVVDDLADPRALELMLD